MLDFDINMAKIGSINAKLAYTIETGSKASVS